MWVGQNLPEEGRLPMSTDRQLVDDLARVADQTGMIIAAIEPEQLDRPTPCGSWDVGTLVGHVVQDVRQFTDRARGRAGGKGSAADLAEGGTNGAMAYRRAADSLVQAWREDGALEGTVELPFGSFRPVWFVGQAVADLAVHGWDLAKATGQPTDLDTRIGETALAWGRENLRPEFRGEQFGPEVAVAEDAPVYERLAAFFGRDPGWTGG
jgi:uncharacterized protein (TIGR03086 family)